MKADLSYTEVLDHGFVRLQHVSMSDQDVVRIARVSTGKGLKTEERDKKFLDYLLRHDHMSPFEFPSMTFQVKAPIFVARQLFRHRTAKVNEYSGRYSEMPEEMYTPDPERFQHEASDNRQGSQGALDDEAADFTSRLMEADKEVALNCYRDYLERGVSKEVARINLPLSQYTVFYWQQDLRNLLHMLHLRMDNHAQWEVQEYARVIWGMVQEHFPWTSEAYENHVLKGVRFSRQERKVLTELLLALEGSVFPLLMEHTKNMSRSHQREFFDKIGFWPKETQ